MPRLRTTRCSPDRDLHPLVRLWMLRLLVRAGGHHRFLGEYHPTEDSISEALGLDQVWKEDDRDYSRQAALAYLKQFHAEAEAAAGITEAPAILARNTERLADLIGLTETDRRILEFAVLIHNNRVLDDTADQVGSLPSTKVLQVLATVLARPDVEIRASLSAQGVLNQSGLVSLDRSGSQMLRGKLDILSESFADGMLTEDADPITLLRESIRPSTPPTLGLSDFSHAASTLEVLSPYLRHALDTRRRGVNVLVYGDPGTGKSQLARVLATDLAVPLFEVASEDASGDPVSGNRRLRAFRAAQTFFARQRALILFDETEDIFRDSDERFERASSAQRRKAWMNRALEENPAPALWLSNSVTCFDPAFIRRFDVVLELGVPPKTDRERIAVAACGDLVDAMSLRRLVAAETLAPAVVTRAAAVVHAIRDRLPAARASHAVCQLVEATLVAQGHKPLAGGDGNDVPEHYDPRFANADADLDAIAVGLAESRSGRLCLYGPPGTGKSAFGRWLADRLGMPLQVRRVSDIVSPYVGMTERNILRAFREAERAKSVLLLDEVDSFLQDRRGAQRSWEVTEVNEMLTQMEAFSGVFIATTNLMDGIDQAALRRFDLKLRFGYLSPDQAWSLLACYCQALGLPAPGPEHARVLDALRVLTPGDFAAVARQHRFRRVANADRLIEALRGECELKDGYVKQAIGFR